MLVALEFGVYLSESEPIFRIQYLYEKAKQRREEKRRQQGR